MHVVGVSREHAVERLAELKARRNGKVTQDGKGGGGVGIISGVYSISRSYR